MYLFYPITRLTLYVKQVWAGVWGSFFRPIQKHKCPHMGGWHGICYASNLHAINYNNMYWHSLCYCLFPFGVFYASDNCSLKRFLFYLGLIVGHFD